MLKSSPANKATIKIVKPEPSQERGPVGDRDHDPSGRVWCEKNKITGVNCAAAEARDELVRLPHEPPPLGAGEGADGVQETLRSPSASSTSSSAAGSGTGADGGVFGARARSPA